MAGTITPNEDVVESQDDQNALNKAREKMSVFNFKMVGIPAGTELYFVRDENIKCTVKDNRNVDYNGEVSSLSAAARQILQDNFNWNCSQVQGSLYWCYDDETLTDRRIRMERE